jgi:hypothetical protein
MKPVLSQIFKWLPRPGLLLILFALSGLCFTLNAAEPRKVIPLPGQSYFAPTGVQAGTALGSFSPAGCKNLFVWQGQAEYAYTENISGGGHFRHFGGSLDNSSSLSYSRYYIHSRFHLAGENSSLFFSPFVGLDQSDLANFQSSSSEEDEVASATRCEENYEAGGVGLGWFAGAGWRISQTWGLTVGQRFEYQIQGERNIALSLGLSWDAWMVWKRLQDYSKASFVYFELNPNIQFQDATMEMALVLGYSLGF